MLFFLAGSALVQYVKYLIAPDFQIEQDTRLDEQAPSVKPVAPPDSKLGSSAQGCVCKVSPGAHRNCGESCGQVARSAGGQFGMAAAVLRMTCCRSLCKLPGRPLHGQEAREHGSALCSQLFPGLPFALF